MINLGEMDKPLVPLPPEMMESLLAIEDTHLRLLRKLALDEFGGMYQNVKYNFRIVLTRENIPDGSPMKVTKYMKRKKDSYVTEHMLQFYVALVVNDSFEWTDPIKAFHGCPFHVGITFIKSRAKFIKTDEAWENEER